MHSENNPGIMIITQGLSRIVAPIVSRHNVVGVIESAARRSKDRGLLFSILKRVYSFFSTGRETLETYCADRKIPYFYMYDGNSKELEYWIKDKKPDVIIVYSMSQLLTRNIFDIPKYKTLNLHPSLLPKYRGPNPWFWSYYNVEKQGGVTLHYIDSGEDTGDIVYQAEYEIPLGMKSPQMQELAIGKLGVQLISKALSNLEHLPRTPQPVESPTRRARNISDDEHDTIIDWEEWSIERIWHILGGTELWLNAIEQPRGIYSGQRWCVEGYEKTEIDGYETARVFRENGRYFVVCREGIIYLSVRFSLKNFVMGFLG